MSKLLPVTLVGTALSAAFCSSALAADQMYHGNFCAPNRDHVSRIERSKSGVFNTSSSTTATVECPFNVPFSGALKVSSVTVTVYDRNSSTNVSCTLTGVSISGDTLWSTSKSSSGSQAGHQFLVLQPSNGSLLGTANLKCSIPPSTNSGSSYVTTYRIITTP